MSSCLPPLTFLTWGIRCASQAPWSVWSLSTSIEVTWTAWIRTPIGFWWFGNKNHGFDAKKLDVYPVKFSRWPWYLQKKYVFRCGELIEICSKKWRWCFGAPSEVYRSMGAPKTWRLVEAALLVESLCFLNKDLHKLLVNPVKWPYMDVCISGR